MWLPNVKYLQLTEHIIVKVQFGCLAGSLSISGAVTRRVLVVMYIQFNSLLFAYSSCLMPYTLPSFMMCCSVGSADPTAIYAIPAVLGSCNPFLYNAFCYACWDSLSALCMLDSLSGFTLACWDTMSGFLAYDWLLLTGVYPRVSVVSLAVIDGYL